MNEIATMSGSYSRSYDAAGNLAVVPDPNSQSFTATYDTWNRLVELDSRSGTPAFEYDGLGRRIVRDQNTLQWGRGKVDFYCDEEWQPLQEDK